MLCVFLNHFPPYFFETGSLQDFRLDWLDQLASDWRIHVSPLPQLWEYPGSYHSRPFTSELGIQTQACLESTMPTEPGVLSLHGPSPPGPESCYVVQSDRNNPQARISHVLRLWGSASTPDKLTWRLSECSPLVTENRKGVFSAPVFRIEFWSE